MKLSLIIGQQDAEQPQQRGSRRIWEVDPTVVALVTGVLLRREDVESILDTVGHDCDGAREDALRVRLLVGCTTPCSLAEQVEHALEGHTQEFRGPVEGCPMMQLADFWSRERERMSGEQIAALLWRLSCDPRPHLEGLSSRVSGDLCVRAMRLLREDPGIGQREDARPQGTFTAPGVRAGSPSVEVSSSAMC